MDIGYKSEGVIPVTSSTTSKPSKSVMKWTSPLKSSKTRMAWSSCQGKAEFKQNWEKILTICNEGGRIRRQKSNPWSKVDWSSTSARLSCPRPRSTSSLRRISRSSSATRLRFQGRQINQERQNIVLSRRELIEAERTEAPPEIALRHGARRHPQGHGQEHHRLWCVH